MVSVKRAKIIELLAAVLMVSGCAQAYREPSVVQGKWGTDHIADCDAWSLTIDSSRMTIRMAKAPLDLDIEMNEDSHGADVSIYLLGRPVSRQMHAIYPMRISVDNGEMTISSDNDVPLGKAWVRLLQTMQPYHRCSNP
jgi:hypothetical protein